MRDEELLELMEDLQSRDLSVRTSTLKALRIYPSEDVRVFPYLEALLKDETPCLVMIPYRFGEVRWLAAQALSAEYRKLGIEKTILLKNIPRPLDTEELTTLMDKKGETMKGGIDGALDAFSRLRKAGYLPLYDLQI